MSDIDIDLYNEIIEGLTLNRELEVYYNSNTYGVVTSGSVGNSGEIMNF